MTENSDPTVAVETISSERTPLPRFTPGTEALPAGWRLHVTPGPLRIGYRVDGCYDLQRAPQHVQDEAAALGVTDYDPVITRSWGITKGRAVRFAREIVAEVAATPVEEWL